ncbi:hypothetical protein SDC9_192571 [bioreactor metagenome]|uniref:DUF5680 domain-containing protein n=1 Tax=bioreactor metagenome TaxID=1076179 RepID=A0A645I9L5_9ZZZZ
MAGRGDDAARALERFGVLCYDAVNHIIMHEGNANMNKEIISFLIKAKQSTYASKGGETASSRKKSHDLMYRDANYMYYDTYLGGSKFAGEEALWISENPYWCMNYAGRVIGDHFSGDFFERSAAPRA